MNSNFSDFPFRVPKPKITAFQKGVLPALLIEIGVRAASLVDPSTRVTLVQRQILEILGSRCAAAGPPGVAWPAVIPSRALMRKTPRMRRFLFYITQAN